MSRVSEREAEKTEAVKLLKEFVKPGTTVYTVLRKVSSSGMSRQIDCYVIQDGRPRWITGLVAKACGIPRADQGHGPLRVGGCGMDMGFHVVYSLASVLFRDGWRCIGQKRRCPANDHVNDYGAFSHRYDEEHDPSGEMCYSGRPETYEARSAYVAAKNAAYDETEDQRWSRSRKHSDPGYALRHEWL